MSEKEKKDIKAMVQSARYLAETSMDILKARCDLEKAAQVQEKEEATND